MRKLLGIARYTFIEIFRNKIWYVLVLFSGILILSTILLGSLGGEQRNRMIIDLGLTTIEAISFLSALFIAVTLVLEEMESRTLYLILTRPVARSVFILGRFLGLVGIMTSTFLLMSGAHALLLHLLHIPMDGHYVLSLLFSWQKVVVITGVAVVFSLFATSTPSAMTLTFFFWVMGHLSSEIRFLAQKTSQPLLIFACDAFYYLFPNFQVMNIRDMEPHVYSLRWLWSAGGYAFSYTLVCLGLASILFRKKEF